jgi:hypothetical protein
VKILTILARHGRTKYPRALEELRERQRRHLPGSACDVLIVDNAPGDGAGADHGCEVIVGSNRAWEFSAWDDALAHVGPRAWKYDFVQLVTSAFNTLYTSYLDRIDDAALGLVAGRAVAVGHVDWYGEPIELLGVHSQHWIRSSYLLMPPGELVALGRLAGLAEPARFFSGDPADPFRADAPISENYRRYVLDWLTGDGTGQGVAWHSRFQLDATTLPLFEAKTMAILTEHWLSIRLRRQGCAIVDATWLATQAARLGRAGVETLPGWRIQLAGRDTDAVPLDAC